MQWLNDLISTVTGNKYDISAVKQKVQASEPGVIVTNDELEAYIKDISLRIKKMVKDLKQIYGKYDIQFSGFKSLDLCCDSLRSSLTDGKEEAYNNLIKLESAITTEQKRHLGLIKMAIAKNGQKVIDLINQDPFTKERFTKIFGERDVVGKNNVDGTYQRLWSEIHKLSEYIITQKNKVYH